MGGLMHRPIAPLSLAGVSPGGTPRAQPIFEWVNPADLLVDDGYQRDSSERSLRLVRKIVSNWDWARYKPPVAVLTDAGLELIDGQHTAIAAATHPEIEQIPVMIVEVAERAERASAFIGHNKDRIAVTTPQLHVAALAAGDSDAQAIADTARRAGVTILRASKKKGYQPGDTLAVTAIDQLIRGRGQDGAAAVLSVLVAAGQAPITQVHIKATDYLLHSPEFVGQITEAALSASIVAMRPQIDSEVDLFRAAHPSTPAWRAMAILWFKNRRSGGRLKSEPSEPAPLKTRAGKLLEPINVKRTPVAMPDDYEDRPRVLSQPQQKGESIFGGAKKDAREKLRGWAPGNHLRRCGPCGASFIGHLRATECADCAYRADAVARAV